MYSNPYTPGFEVLSKSGYSLDTPHSASYLVTNDFPDYAAMFYSPTEHEVLTSIKYGNFDQDYSNVREIQKSLNGPDIEFYIPRSFEVGDGVGKQTGVEIVPDGIRDKLIDAMHKEAKKEIENAQRQVKRRRVKVEVEDVLLLRKRKMSVVFEEKE
jgi:hypothetical protein